MSITKNIVSTLLSIVTLGLIRYKRKNKVTKIKNSDGSKTIIRDSDTDIVLDKED